MKHILNIVLTVIFGIITVGLFCAFTSLPDYDLGVVITFVVLLILSGTGLTYNIIMLAKRKKRNSSAKPDISKSTIESHIWQATPISTPSTDLSEEISPETPNKKFELTTKAVDNSQNESAVYVISDNTVSRADKKTISDEEVSYHIESSYQRLISTENEYKSGKRNIFNDNHFSKEEDIFFRTVHSEFVKAGLKPNLIKLTRLSSGIFNVDYIDEGYVGKVKIREQRSYYIQYFIGMKVHDYETDSLNELIETIPRWVRYVKYMKRM